MCIRDSVHTADFIDLIIINFRENQLLPDTHGIVSAAVKGVGVNAPEVPHAGKREIEETDVYKRQI